MTPVEHIRDLTGQLPEAAERTSAGEPVFFVDGHAFAQMRGEQAVCVRAADADEQAQLIAAAPDVYSPASDFGSDAWIAIDLGCEPDWALVEDRIARSWELTAPARLLEAGGR